MTKIFFKTLGAMGFMFILFVVITLIVSLLGLIWEPLGYILLVIATFTAVFFDMKKKYYKKP